MKEIIIKLVKGISKLHVIMEEINEDYLKGRITDNHHLYLLEHENKINTKLRKILAQY